MAVKFAKIRSFFLTALSTSTIAGCAHQPVKPFEKVDEESRSEMKITTYKRAPAEIFKVMSLREKISHVKFLAKVENQQIYLKRLYKASIEPYFGKPDKDVECSNRVTAMLATPLGVLVKETPIVSFAKYDLRATENQIYGTCDYRVEKLDSEFLMIHCKAEQRYFEIKSFNPASTESPPSLYPSMWLDFTKLCQTGIPF